MNGASRRLNDLARTYFVLKPSNGSTAGNQNQNNFRYQGGIKVRF